MINFNFLILKSLQTDNVNRWLDFGPHADIIVWHVNSLDAINDVKMCGL